MKNLVKFLGAALAVAAVFYMIGGLFAHHFKLVVLDPDKQRPGAAGCENRILQEWMTGSSVKWTLRAPANRRAECAALATSAINE